MSFVYTKEGFVEPERATIPAADAGLLHGVGLFETMLARRGRVHRLAEHLERLAESAELLGLASTLRPDPLGDLLIEAAERARDEHDLTRLRLTLTGGDLNLLERGAKVHQPTILIHATRATPYPQELYEKGIAAGLADLRVNPFDRFEPHKTLNYWRRLSALQDAAQKGLGEAIVLQVTGHLAGGCVSNLMLVKDGAILTPIARGEEPKAGVPSPVLPGIARRAIIEQAQVRQIDVQRRMLAIDDLLDADEAFLTSSTVGVLPIVAVEGKQIAAGTPGPITRDLLDAWRGELAALGDEL